HTTRSPVADTRAAPIAARPLRFPGSEPWVGPSHSRAPLSLPRHLPERPHATRRRCAAKSYILGLMASQIVPADFPRLSYSLSEAEVLSGLSRATLYRRIADGSLRTAKVGRRRLVPADGLASLVQGGARSAP